MPIVFLVFWGLLVDEVRLDDGSGKTAEVESSVAGGVAAMMR